MNKRKGMSLIVLVITILVMIILAGVVIVSLSDNNPIKKANEATVKQNAMSYVTELSTAKANSTMLGNDEDFDNKDIVGQDVKKYVPSISGKDLKNYEIINGNLAYVGKDKKISDIIKDTSIIDQNPYRLKTEVSSTSLGNYVKVYGDVIYNFIPNSTNCPVVTENTLELKQLNSYTLSEPIYIRPYNPVVAVDRNGDTVIVEIGQTTDKIVYNNLTKGTGKVILTRAGETVQQVVSFDQLEDGTYTLLFTSRIGNLNQSTFVKLDSNLNKISEKVIIPSNRKSAYISSAQKLKNGNTVYAGYNLDSAATRTFIYILDKNGDRVLEDIGTGSANESTRLYNLNGKIYYLKIYSAASPATYKIGEISESNKIENERVFDVSSVLPEGMNGIYITATNEGEIILAATPGVGFMSSTYFTIIKFRMSDLKIRWSQRYENSELFGDCNLFAGTSLITQIDTNKFTMLISSKSATNTLKYHKVNINM